MMTEQPVKRGTEFVGDLQHQRAGEAIFQIGRDKATDMSEIVPDCGPSKTAVSAPVPWASANRQSSPAGRVPTPRRLNGRAVQIGIDRAAKISGASIR